MLRHDSFHGGKVQRLAITIKDCAEFGIFKPGDYDFGITKRPEKITIIFGTLHEDGIGQVYHAGQTYTTTIGQPIQISVKEKDGLVIYFSRYLD